MSATEQHFDMHLHRSPLFVVALIGTVARDGARGHNRAQRLRCPSQHPGGRYRGSQPPWGYKPEETTRATWRLVHDSEQVQMSTRLHSRVIDKNRYRQWIAHV